MTNRLKNIPFKVSENELILIRQMAKNETNGNVSELIRRKLFNEYNLGFERLEKLLIETFKASGFLSKAIELKFFNDEKDKNLIKEIKKDLKEYISKL